jgi:hypothetical protein
MRWEEIDPLTIDGLMALETLSTAFLKGTLEIGDDYILAVYEKPTTLFNKEKLMGGATGLDKAD